MGVLVGEDEVVKRRWGIGQHWGRRSTVPIALPSIGDEKLLDGGCMAGRSVAMVRMVVWRSV